MVLPPVSQVNGYHIDLKSGIRHLWSMSVSRDFIADVLGIRLSATSRILTIYRSRARRRGREFALSWGDVHALVWNPCAYCGAAPTNTITLWDETDDFILRYQGIDRIDNSIGYVPGNVAPCCAACNSAKGTDTFAGFVERSRRVGAAP